MATATVKQPIPTPPPPEIVLTLSLEEAGMLRAILGAIGGVSPLRSTIDAIYWELRDVVDVAVPDVFLGTATVRNGISARSLNPRLVKPE